MTVRKCGRPTCREAKIIYMHIMNQLAQTTLSSLVQGPWTDSTVSGHQPGSVELEIVERHVSMGPAVPNKFY